jgi:hypothetical protein
VIIALQIYQAHKTAGYSHTGNATSFTNLVFSRSTIFTAELLVKGMRLLRKTLQGIAAFLQYFTKYDSVFRDLTLYSLVKVNRHFGELIASIFRIE